MNCCFVCKKNLKLSQLTIGKCKCQKVFCKNHIHNHKCDYNYKENHQSQLHTNLQVVEFEKVSGI